MFDLVDQAQALENAELREHVTQQVKTIFNSVDENLKLDLCRELMIEQIYTIVDKFPQQTQKEIMTMVARKYLCEWHKQ